MRIRKTGPLYLVHLLMSYLRDSLADEQVDEQGRSWRSGAKVKFPYFPSETNISELIWLDGGNLLCNEDNLPW
jgi:hypothetical protein